MQLHSPPFSRGFINRKFSDKLEFVILYEYIFLSCQALYRIVPCKEILIRNVHKMWYGLLQGTDYQFFSLSYQYRHNLVKHLLLYCNAYLLPYRLHKHLGKGLFYHESHSL